MSATEHEETMDAALAAMEATEMFDITEMARTAKVAADAFAAYQRAFEEAHAAYSRLHQASEEANNGTGTAKALRENILLAEQANEAAIAARNAYTAAAAEAETAAEATMTADIPPHRAGRRRKSRRRKSRRRKSMRR